MLDSVVRLRMAVFGCLSAAGMLGLWLTWIGGVQLNTPIVRTTFYFFLGALSLSALFWLIGRYVLRCERRHERADGTTSSPTSSRLWR